jgi:hypothetical protein
MSASTAAVRSWGDRLLQLSARQARSWSMQRVRIFVPSRSHSLSSRSRPVFVVDGGALEVRKIPLIPGLARLATLVPRSPADPACRSGKSRPGDGVVEKSAVARTLASQIALTVSDFAPGPAERSTPHQCSLRISRLCLASRSRHLVGRAHLRGFRVRGHATPEHPRAIRPLPQALRFPLGPVRRRVLYGDSSGAPRTCATGSDRSCDAPSLARATAARATELTERECVERSGRSSSWHLPPRPQSPAY